MTEQGKENETKLPLVSQSMKERMEKYHPEPKYALTT